MTIPFAPPSLDIMEKQAVLDVLDSGWLSRGPKCEQFERAVAERVGAAHAVSLSSCTAALHLALLAMDIGPGDEVITSPLTFPATVNAILYAGATPVFVDVRPDYNIDPLLAYRALTDKTKAVIGVDMHGKPCRRLELPQGVRFIRDAAHSLGAITSEGMRVGEDADATCFSFYATKQITTGDGGMLTTNDAGLADRVRRLSLHGMDSQAWKRYAPGARAIWDIPEIGYKCNLTDIQAAIGLEQLKKLNRFLQARLTLAAEYDALLGPLVYEGLLEYPPIKSCWHLYAVRVKEKVGRYVPEPGRWPTGVILGKRPGRRRDEVVDHLRQNGIGCGIHFRPVHTLSAYAQLLQGRTPEQLTPIACEIGAETLSLPFFVGMTSDQQERVVEVLTAALQ